MLGSLLLYCIITEQFNFQVCIKSPKTISAVTLEHYYGIPGSKDMAATICISLDNAREITQLFVVRVEVRAGHSIPVSLELPFEGRILLPRKRSAMGHTAIRHANSGPE